MAEPSVQDFDQLADQPIPLLGRDRLRHGARWTGRAFLLFATLVAAVTQGGASLQALTTISVLVGFAWACVWLATPDKPPRGRLPLLWIGLGIYTLLQTIPLPHGIVAALSPNAARISDAGRAALGLQPAMFLPMAISVGDAAHQSALFLVAGVYGLLVSYLFMGEHSRDLARFATLVAALIALGAATISALAWSPIAASWVPGSLVIPLRQIALVNPNHAAGIINFAIALMLGRAMTSEETSGRNFANLLILYGTALLALLGSRGGFVTWIGVMALGAYFVARPHKRTRVDPRELQKIALRSFGSLAVALVVVVALVALPVLESEFVGSMKNDPKLKAFSAIWPLMAQVQPFGGGPGSLPVLAGYQTSVGNVRLDFTENFLSQRLFDSGFIIALVFIGLLLWRMAVLFRARGYTPLLPSLWAAPATLLAANLVDFSMELPLGLLLWMIPISVSERLGKDPGGVHQTVQRARRIKRQYWWGGGACITLLAAMLALASGRETRATEAVLEGRTAAEAKQLVADRFVHDHHAFYLVGRMLASAQRPQEALRAFDRALRLRPDSKYARLFRFATLVELHQDDLASQELRRLLAMDAETQERAFRICLRSSRAEQMLVQVIPQLADISYQIGKFLAPRRPDLVEKLALTLRQRYPDKRYGIEAIRADLYIARGQVKAAEKIAVALLIQPETQDLGWETQAGVLTATGHQPQAFHLYADLCARHNQDDTLCQAAINNAIVANDPTQLFEFMQSQRERMLAAPHTAVRYWRAMAIGYSQDGRLEQSVEAARATLALFPEDLSAIVFLAERLLQLGRAEEARNVLAGVDEASATDPRILKLKRMIERDMSTIPEGLRDLDLDAPKVGLGAPKVGLGKAPSPTQAPWATQAGLRQLAPAVAIPSTPTPTP